MTSVVELACYIQFVSFLETSPRFIPFPSALYSAGRDGRGNDVIHRFPVTISLQLHYLSLITSKSSVLLYVHIFI